MFDIPRDAMAWTAGVLLGVYILGIVYALTRTPRRPDPQRGQAVGCLMIVVAALLVLEAALAVGVYWDIGFLIRAPFWVAVFPLLSLAGSGVLHVFQRLRGRG